MKNKIWASVYFSKSSDLQQDKIVVSRIKEEIEKQYPEFKVTVVSGIGHKRHNEVCFIENGQEMFEKEDLIEEIVNQFI